MTPDPQDFARALEDIPSYYPPEKVHNAECAKYLEEYQAIITFALKAMQELCKEPTPEVIGKGFLKVNCGKMAWEDRQNNIVDIFKAMRDEILRRAKSDE